MVLVARTAGDPAAIAASIHQAVREIDPEQPVYDVRTMEDVVQRSLGQRWLNMALLVSFAGVALLLCAIGVYGVIAFGVTRQRREFGIRLALGATRQAIEGAVVGRGLMLAASGTVIGLGLAVVVARGMRSLLFGIDPGDLASFAAAAGAVVVVAVVASYLPARRAAAVEPAVTLRAE
jgi:ABC-type antimicrobial peptide transport system permease subunit